MSKTRGGKIKPNPQTQSSLGGSITRPFSSIYVNPLQDWVELTHELSCQNIFRRHFLLFDMLFIAIIKKKKILFGTKNL